MKKTILIILVSIIGITLHAQDEISFNNQHSIGLNINSIVNSSDFGIFYSPSTPYTLIYRYNMENWAFKAGFGGSFSSSERDNDNSNSESTFKNHLVDFRLGFDRIFMQKQRFSATIGADAIFRTNRNYNQYDTGSTNLSTYDNRGKSVGFGPTTTLDFKITDWITLSTEMSFYISRNSDEYTRNDSNTGFIDEVDTSKGWSSTLNKPTALYINIRF